MSTYDKLDEIARIVPSLEMKAYHAVQEALEDPDDHLLQRAEIVRLALAVADGVVNSHHTTVQSNTEALAEMVRDFYTVEAP